MSRATRYLILVALATVCWTATAAASLPDAAPPANDPLERTDSPVITRLAVSRQQTDQGNATDDSGTQGNQAVRAPEADDSLKLDLLMKRTADPRLDMPGRLDQQLSTLSPFSSLSPEEQQIVVPELLDLLRNRSPLGGGPLVDGAGVLEVRHRANLALAKIARVHFGQFPVHPAGATLSSEDAAADRKASEELIARWKAWWAEAASMDADARQTLSTKLRTGFYETGDEDAFWANVGFAVEQKDSTPTMLVVRRLDALDPTGSISSEAQKLYSYLGSLCTLPDAPPEALLAVLNIVTSINPVTVRRGEDFQGTYQHMQRAGGILQRALGTRGGWLEHKQVEEGEGDNRQTYTSIGVLQTTLDEWEDAICQRIADSLGLPESSMQDDGPDDETPQDGDEVDD